MGNTQSMMWVFEVLGYFFMGISTLFVAPVFGSGRLESYVRWLFVLNGVLGLRARIIINVSRMIDADPFRITIIFTSKIIILE